MADSDKCHVCGSGVGLQEYGMVVQGELLSLVVLLCSEHGSALVFRAGMLIASIRDPIERVFLSESCGFILANCRCEFRKGHEGEHSFEPVLKIMNRRLGTIRE